jgi:hypothetical protein
MVGLVWDLGDYSGTWVTKVDLGDYGGAWVTKVGLGRLRWDLGD